MRKSHFFIAVLASIILSGCASVETSGLQSGAQGVGYYLPKGKFELTVVDDSGGLTATLAGPVMVADERYPLVTRLPRSGTSDNHVTVTVDPKTNLLSKVDVTSTGDVAAIAKSIAKTVAMIQAAGGSSGKTIFDKVYDLTELGDGTAANDVNAFLQQYFAAQCGPATANTMPLGDELTASGYEATVAKADRKTQLLYCRKLSLAGLSTASANTLVTIAVSDRPSPRTTAWRRTDPQTGTAVPDPSFDGGRDCGRGICYRPFRPTRIALEVKGAFSQSGVFLVPDEAQTLFVGLPQGAFAEQKYTLTFTDGVLTEYEQNSKSELVGALALPVDVLETILAAPGEALGLKTTDLKGKAAYLDQVAALEKAKKDAQSACSSSANKCPSTAMRIIGDKITSKDEVGSPPLANKSNTAPSEGGLVVHHDGDGGGG